MLETPERQAPFPAPLIRSAPPRASASGAGDQKVRAAAGESAAGRPLEGAAHLPPPPPRFDVLLPRPPRSAQRDALEAATLAESCAAYFIDRWAVAGQRITVAAQRGPEGLQVSVTVPEALGDHTQSVISYVLGFFARAGVHIARLECNQQCVFIARRAVDSIEFIHQKD